jgi:5'-methylthioadenosine phosphorylase
MADRVVGVIGGSGLYQIDGMTGAEWRKIDSPWGEPSDELLFGELDGAKLVFLPRHGRGHRLSPTDINYRANIDALKRAGVTEVISVSACGSFREEMVPGDFVIVDQFIDQTVNREKSFFGAGLVAHVSVAYPTCPRLGDVLETATKAAGVTTHRGGTYLAMEGPQFSSLAESKMYREAWGADVIGMTNMPEAKLAREAELCYATVAMVTDYDSWRPKSGEVDVTEIMKVLAANTAHAAKMIANVAPMLAGAHSPCEHGCNNALEYALITAPEVRDPALVAKLDAVAGRVL